MGHEKINRENLKWNLITIGLLSIVLGVVFRRYIFEGYMFFSLGRLSDLIRANLPTYYLMYDSIAEGGNFWSWKMGIGTSMFSHADVFFDPFTYIVLMFGRNMIPQMMLWSYMIKLVCQSLSMTVFLRYFNLNNIAVCIASILYTISGYSLIMGSNFALGTILVYFPLLLLGAEQYISKQKKGALFISLVSICLYSYYFFYISGILLAIYVFVRAKMLKTNGIPKLCTLVIMAIGCVLCSAIAILPQLQLISANPRLSDGKSVSFAIELFVPQIEVLATTVARLFNNDILGSGVSSPYMGIGYNGSTDYFQLACFTGSFFVILIFQLWILNERYRKTIVTVTTMVVLLTVFPVFSYMFNAFSHINYRWMYVITVLISILYAFAIDEIIRNKGFEWRFLGLGILTSYILIVFSFFVLGYTDEEGLFSTRLRNCFLVSQKYVLIVSVVFVLTILINIVSKKKFDNRVKKYAIAVICGLILIIEGFGNYFHWYTDDSAVCDYNKQLYCGYEDVSDKLIKDIQKKDTEFYRINKTFDSVVNDMGIPSNNDAMAQGYYGLRCYSSMNNSNYINFLQETGNYVAPPILIDHLKNSGVLPKDVNGSSLNYINGVYDSFELMNYLGVKYYLDDSGSDELPYYFKLIDEEEKIKVYQNMAMYPLAFINEKHMSKSQFDELSSDEKSRILLEYTIIDDSEVGVIDDFYLETDIVALAEESQENFRLMDFTEDRVEFEIDIKGNNQYISFSIPYDEDFRVYVDGEETETYKINISLLGVKAEKGTHSIVIEYKPRMVYMGLGISIITLFVVTIMRKWLSSGLDYIEISLNKLIDRMIAIVEFHK